MGKYPKLTTEERNRRKRERERERRRKIREDPVKRKEQREKERQKYKRQKEQNIRKSIKNMTPREQRKVRKQWKNYTRIHRLKGKQEAEVNGQILENTPPPSENENEPEIIRNIVIQESFRERGRRISNRNSVRRYRTKKKTLEQVEYYRKQLEKYKKRCQRLQSKINRKTKNNLKTVKI